mgnify:FL=1
MFCVKSETPQKIFQYQNKESRIFVWYLENSYGNPLSALTTTCIHAINSFEWLTFQNPRLRDELSNYLGVATVAIIQSNPGENH